MVKAMDRIRDVPTEVKELDPALEKFMLAVLFTLIYAPDRHLSAYSKKIQEKFLKLSAHPVHIQTELEKVFFSELYVERREREEIQNLLPALRPILVHGLVGVGKTVVLKKLKDEFEISNGPRFIYLDLRAIIEPLRSAPPEDYSAKFRSYLQSRLYKEYIEEPNSADLFKEWKVYKIVNDSGYSTFRQWLADNEARLPITGDEWQNTLAKPYVADMFRTIVVEPKLTTLLCFLRDCFGLVLCFDNVDRHPLDIQRQLLSLAIDLSNEVQIPVIVSIRESNLERIVSEGAAGDPVLRDYLQRLKSGEEKDVPMGAISYASIRTLLEKRLRFVQKNEALLDLEEFFERIKKELRMDFETYKQELWGLLGLISRTFVRTGIYDYCNHNLREILPFYFSFLTKLLINPEEEYSLEKLLKYGKLVRVTKLRNYFYKWLVCGGELLPAKGAIYNVYDHCAPHLRILDLRILEFISNWVAARHNSRLTFSIIAERFSHFGIRADVMSSRIEALNKNHGRFSLGFIWLDKHKAQSITSGTIIDILPVANYFLLTVSTSREYAFWNALSADLAIDVVGRPFPMKETYDDEFKLQVVANSVEKVLLPAFEDELKYFDQHLVAPRDHHGSNLDYLRKLFSIRGDLYPVRLIRSVKGTIRYATMSDKLKTKYIERFSTLLDKALELQNLP